MDSSGSRTRKSDRLKFRRSSSKIEETAVALAEPEKRCGCGFRYGLVSTFWAHWRFTDRDACIRKLRRRRERQKLAEARTVSSSEPVVKPSQEPSQELAKPPVIPVVLPVSNKCEVSKILEEWNEEEDDWIDHPSKRPRLDASVAIASPGKVTDGKDESNSLLAEGSISPLRDGSNLNQSLTEEISIQVSPLRDKSNEKETLIGQVPSHVSEPLLRDTSHVTSIDPSRAEGSMSPSDKEPVSGEYSTSEASSSLQTGLPLVKLPLSGQLTAESTMAPQNADASHCKTISNEDLSCGASLSPLRDASCGSPVSSSDAIVPVQSPANMTPVPDKEMSPIMPSLSLPSAPQPSSTYDFAESDAFVNYPPLLIPEGKPSSENSKSIISNEEALIYKTELNEELSVTGDKNTVTKKDIPPTSDEVKNEILASIVVRDHSLTSDLKEDNFSGNDNVGSITSSPDDLLDSTSETSCINKSGVSVDNSNKEKSIDDNTVTSRSSLNDLVDGAGKVVPMDTVDAPLNDFNKEHIPDRDDMVPTKSNLVDFVDNTSEVLSHDVFLNNSIKEHFANENTMPSKSSPENLADCDRESLTVSKSDKSLNHVHKKDSSVTENLVPSQSSLEVAYITYKTDPPVDSDVSLNYLNTEHPANADTVPSKISLENLSSESMIAHDTGVIPCPNKALDNSVLPSALQQLANAATERTRSPVPLQCQSKDLSDEHQVSKEVDICSSGLQKLVAAAIEISKPQSPNASSPIKHNNFDNVDLVSSDQSSMTMICDDADKSSSSPTKNVDSNYQSSPVNSPVIASPKRKVCSTKGLDELAAAAAEVSLGQLDSTDDSSTSIVTNELSSSKQAPMSISLQELAAVAVEMPRSPVSVSRKIRVPEGNDSLRKSPLSLCETDVSKLPTLPALSEDSALKHEVVNSFLGELETIVTRNEQHLSSFPALCASDNRVNDKNFSHHEKPQESPVSSLHESNIKTIEVPDKCDASFESNQLPLKTSDIETSAKTVEKIVIVFSSDLTSDTDSITDNKCVDTFSRTAQNDSIVHEPERVDNREQCFNRENENPYCSSDTVVDHDLVSSESNDNSGIALKNSTAKMSFSEDKKCSIPDETDVSCISSLECGRFIEEKDAAFDSPSDCHAYSPIPNSASAGSPPKIVSKKSSPKHDLESTPTSVALSVPESTPTSVALCVPGLSQENTKYSGRDKNSLSATEPSSLHNDDIIKNSQPIKDHECSDKVPLTPAMKVVPDSIPKLSKDVSNAAEDISPVNDLELLTSPSNWTTTTSKAVYSFPEWLQDWQEEAITDSTDPEKSSGTELPSSKSEENNSSKTDPPPLCSREFHDPKNSSVSSNSSVVCEEVVIQSPEESVACSSVPLEPSKELIKCGENPSPDVSMLTLDIEAMPIVFEDDAFVAPPIPLDSVTPPLCLDNLPSPVVLNLHEKDSSGPSKTDLPVKVPSAVPSLLTSAKPLSSRIPMIPAEPILPSQMEKMKPVVIQPIAPNSGSSYVSLVSPCSVKTLPSSVSVPNVPATETSSSTTSMSATPQPMCRRPIKLNLLPNKTEPTSSKRPPGKTHVIDLFPKTRAREFTNNMPRKSRIVVIPGPRNKTTTYPASSTQIVSNRPSQQSALSVPRKVTRVPIGGECHFDWGDRLHVYLTYSSNSNSEFTTLYCRTTGAKIQVPTPRRNTHVKVKVTRNKKFSFTLPDLPTVGPRALLPGPSSQMSTSTPLMSGQGNLQLPSYTVSTAVPGLVHGNTPLPRLPMVISGNQMARFLRPVGFPRSREVTRIVPGPGSFRRGVDRSLLILSNNNFGLSSSSNPDLPSTSGMTPSSIVLRPPANKKTIVPSSSNTTKK